MSRPTDDDVAGWQPGTLTTWSLDTDCGMCRLDDGGELPVQGYQCVAFGATPHRGQRVVVELIGERVARVSTAKPRTA